MRAKIHRPSVVLFAVLALIIGALLFGWGMVDDAPGMILIGLAAAFSLLALAVKKSGILPPGYLFPILLLGFGVGALVLSVGWFIDTEFKSTPQFPIIALALGVLLLWVGVLGFKKVRRKG